MRVGFGYYAVSDPYLFKQKRTIFILSHFHIMLDINTYL